MEKTFIFDIKIAKKILKDHKDFLNLQNNQTNSDEYRIRILGILKKLSAKQFSRILEKSFEASLKKEEGLHHSFSLVLSPPEDNFSDLLGSFAQKHFHGSFEDVCSFEIPVDIKFLHKIAPAFESTNKKLRVWFNNKDEIKIWGFASHFFDYWGLEIKSFSPGQILIHIKSQDFPYKRYLMTLSESKCVVSNDSLFDLLFDESDKKNFRDTSNRENFIRFGHRQRKRYWFLIDVINKIMNHKHGGILLFISEENSEEILKESIRSISYQPKNKYEYTERKFINEENEIVYSDKNQVSRIQAFLGRSLTMQIS